MKSDQRQGAVLGIIQWRDNRQTTVFRAFVTTLVHVLQKRVPVGDIVFNLLPVFAERGRNQFREGAVG